MATAIKTSLEKVLQAYTVGDQKFSLSPIHKSAVGLGSYLPEQERHLLRPYEELIKQGLVAARRGDLAAARQLFDSSQSLLSSVPFSDEGLLLCKSTYNAAASYLDYCRKDFTTALERLDEALVIDEQLERRKKEYEPLQLHRVQLLLNSIQVHIKRNHPQEALSMSFHILNYLEGKINTIPAPSSWDSATLKPLPQEVITDLFV